MARIALDPVQPAGVNRDYRALHIDQIVFAQYLVLYPFRCWAADGAPAT